MGHRPNCESCGAVLLAHVDRCQLCGHLVYEMVEGDAPESNIDDAGEEGSVERPSECPTCSHSNPQSSNFCNNCGALLQPEFDTQSEDDLEQGVDAIPGLAEVKPQGSSRAGLVLVAALVTAGGLFLLSNARFETSSPTESVTAEASIPQPSVIPIPDDVQQEIDEMVREIEGLSGEEKIRQKRALLLLYSDEGRLDLAGDVQREIAEELDTEVEWIRAGNLYFDWMETRSGAGKIAYAKRAIAAYTRALEINPDNLDARTDMAIAYLYDPDNPMEAIRNTNMVLEKDSLHIQANYNKGIMLLNINRLDQALAQFQKVMTLVGDPNDPVYMRARDAMDAVMSRRAS